MPEDSENTPWNTSPDRVVPRTSSDTTVNTQGRLLRDMCVGSRLSILNGRKHGDLLYN